MKYVKKCVQTFDVVHITTNKNQCFNWLFKMVWMNWFTEMNLLVYT